MKELEDYYCSWERFRVKCDKKVKEADCYINNKSWNKLKEFHLEEYLKKIKKPFKFLIMVKFKKPHIYKTTKGMARMYHEYKRKRRELFPTEMADIDIFAKNKFYITSKNT